MKPLINKLLSFLGYEIRRIRPPANENGYDRATSDDLYYCIRLFLEVPSSGVVWDTYNSLVQHGISVGNLVDLFLFSSHFKTLQAKRLNERQRTHLVNLDGFDLYVFNDPLVGSFIIEHKEYEAHVTKLLKSLLHEGDTFVDVGANIGYFTMLGSSLVGPGRVISIEPGTASFRVLEKNVQLNNFGNIELLNCAVADRNQLVLYDDLQASGNIFEYNPEVANAFARLTLESKTLDSLIEGKVDVIKIDVEGAEYLALRGCQRIIEEHHPIIISEYSPSQLEAASKVSGRAYLELILDYGYSISVIEEDRLIDCPDIESVERFFQEKGQNHIDILCRFK